jgi:hypothetical protein
MGFSIHPGMLKATLMPYLSFRDRELNLGFAGF